jgi:8-oxo-dGTP diphosphatase
MNATSKIKAARAAAIILRNKSILLMYRNKGGKTYYVLPGGTVEAGEEPEEAVLREVLEETSLQVHLVRLLYHIQITDDAICKDEYYYLCDYVSGIPQIQHDAIEQERMKSGTSYYELKWVKLEDIEKLLVYPLEIRDWLLHDLQNDFEDNVRETKLLRTEMRQK